MLRHKNRKVALISLDLIGLQYPAVLKVRERLADYTYVVVSSTHNHEGPDVIGVWGRTIFQRGVDEAYVSTVVDQVVQLVRSGGDGACSGWFPFRVGRRRDALG